MVISPVSVVFVELLRAAVCVEFVELLRGAAGVEFVVMLRAARLYSFPITKIKTIVAITFILTDFWYEKKIEA